MYKSIKKFKSLIIIMLIVPMFLLSYQKPAKAITGVEEVVVIAGVCFTVSVCAALLVNAGQYSGYKVKEAYGEDVKTYFKNKLLSLGADALSSYFATNVDSSGKEYLSLTDDGYNYARTDWKKFNSEWSEVDKFMHSTSKTTSNTDTSSTKEPFMSNGFYMTPYDYASLDNVFSSFRVSASDKFSYQMITYNGACYDGSFIPLESCFIRFVQWYNNQTSCQYSYDGVRWYELLNVFNPPNTCVKIGYKTVSNTVYVAGNSVLTNTGIEEGVKAGTAVSIPISGQYSKDGTPVYDGVEGATASAVSGLTANTLSNTITGEGIKISEKNKDRIFRNTQGHLTSDTTTNRKILENVVNDEGNYIGSDEYENEWYTSINRDGTQTWAEVTNGEIVNGGVNEFPIKFDIQSVDDTIADDVTTTTTTGSSVEYKKFTDKLLQSDASKEWGALKDGTNQGVKHFADYWDKFPERIPSLAKRLGIDPKKFAKTNEGFQNFTNEALRVTKSEESQVRNVGDRIMYYFNGAENPKKGVVVIMKDRKLQSMMPSDPKSFLKLK